MTWEMYISRQHVISKNILSLNKHFGYKIGSIMINQGSTRYLSMKNRVTVHAERLNTAPVEFRPNILANSKNPGNLVDTAMKAIRCTSDVSTDNINSAETNQIPFNVKLVSEVDLEERKLKKKNVAINKHDLAYIKKNIINPYLQLTKPRLTILVMLSAICSYALSPYSASMTQLACLTIGTTLCSGAANAINMGREPDYDRQMMRTQARPVVQGQISPKQAFQFATVLGTSGVTLLQLGVNSTVAFLGFSNILLYAWTYTSLKRKHIINTWVGALVGAIPPLMGWAAASSLTHPAAWCLAGLLYAWQFPHFNTLSHNIKNEYKNAGYVMTAWKNPLLNARVSLRYSLLMFPLCFGLSYYGVTDGYYQLDSALVNGWMAFWAFKFYMQQRITYSPSVLQDKTKFNKSMALANVYARKTFWGSIAHLPAVLVLAILHKKGRWDWLFDDGNGDNNNKNNSKILA